MWALLEHPRHVEFYEEYHRGRYHSGEDWQPMVRAVRYLQSHSYATSLFAFTSLAHFQVTTAPSHAEREGHHCVGITWHFPRRQFGLGYSTDPATVFQTCEETAFPAAIDALIQRLLLQPPETQKGGSAYSERL